MTMSNRGSGVSVVIPVFNSASSLVELVERISSVLSSHNRSFEIVLVNDGSTDNSWDVVCDLADRNDVVVGVRLSRNYGQHNALLAGTRLARYPIIVTMDDDLEHRPESIPILIDALADDVDLVYATPSVENHSIGRNIASRVTKRAMAVTLGPDVAARASAFRLFRTRLRDSFAGCSDPFVAFDVLLSWGTTRVAFVTVEMDKRRYGRSNYTLRSLSRHAFNLITGYSAVPLRLVSWIGFGTACLGLLAMVWVVGNTIVHGVAVQGFAFVACSVALFSGAQLIALGLMGEYLGRMHFRSMDRPVYTIAATTGQAEPPSEQV